MEKTEAQLWKEQYETLLQEYTTQQSELEDWRSGDITSKILRNVINHYDADQGVSWLTIRTEIEKFINK